MTADPWIEDARGIWQSPDADVTRMSAGDMRARADRWRTEFARTNWIAFACAGLLLAFFGLMLAIHQTALQRTGAVVGIAAAVYLAAAGLRISSRRLSDDSATCIRAYTSQLERRRRADMDSARTIVMVMTAAALLSEQAGWGAWVLQAGSQLAAGAIVYVYVARQARRFQQRIDELTGLEER